jgi:hypothetical protein
VKEVIGVAKTSDFKFCKSIKPQPQPAPAVALHPTMTPRQAAMQAAMMMVLGAAAAANQALVPAGQQPHLKHVQGGEIFIIQIYVLVLCERSASMHCHPATVQYVAICTYLQQSLG